MATELKSPLLSNKYYDYLKWVALIVLPAIGAAYFGIAQIWGLPYGEEVVGTVVVIETLLGAILGVSTMNYEKASVGEIYPDANDEPDRATLDLPKHPTEYEDGETLTLRVKRTDSQ